MGETRGDGETTRVRRFPPLSEVANPKGETRRQGDKETRRQGDKGKTPNNYQLPITNYQLPITNYQLPTINYQLSITNAQCPMPNAQCPMPNAPFPIPNNPTYHHSYSPNVLIQFGSTFPKLSPCRIKLVQQQKPPLKLPFLLRFQLWF